MAGLGFARSQLEKQGWTEGKGLGKEEDGITKAIKVGIKNDTRGVGYKISDQFTFHWWDHVFNKTAKSIVVNENEDGVHLSKDGSSNQPISNKRPNKHSQKPLLYGRFVKASSNAASDEAENGSESTDDEAEKDFSTGHPEDIVFKACGGRTAHKGARHGLKLNGKLKRIEEHERMAISAPCSRSANPDITKEHDIEQKTAELLDQSRSKKKKRRSNDDVKSYSDSEGCLVKKESKMKRRHIEETELESEVYEEQSKKKKKNNSKKDFCEEKEESSSCSSLPKTKKKRKDRNRMEGNVNDKIEKKKKNKSLDSNDNEQCSGLENQQSTEGAKTKKDKAKTKDSIAKSKEKVVTEDKKRKTKKRKATKNETISRTKTNDNELRSESEESSARKKKKKKRDKRN